MRKYRQIILIVFLGSLVSSGCGTEKPGTPTVDTPVSTSISSDIDQITPEGTIADLSASTSPQEPPDSELPSEPPESTAVDEPTEEPETDETVIEPAEDSSSDTQDQTAGQETNAPAPAGSPAKTLSFELVMSGFVKPTFLTNAGDERVFVTEQDGRIWVAAGGQVFEYPFLDIRQKVGSSASEQGLLSVAFHPNFSSNGYFFVNYTDQSGDTVVSRFEVSDEDPNIALPDSERVVISIEQPYGNHNGGQLQFGPDGYLYVGMGDGGSGGDPQGNGQNAATLLGSLLRIDIDSQEPYSIPADNPFVNDPAARNEIWAIGLRNPWRFSFDRQSGDLFLADVGQNQWEEIDYLRFSDPGGVNFGWNELEASHCYNSNSCDDTGTAMPIAEYMHEGGNCSVTGGYIYRGTAYPSLTGNYLFGDYCSGTVWSLFQQTDGGWQMTEAAQIDANISSFGEDVNGEIYVLDLSAGAIYRVNP